MERSLYATLPLLAALGPPELVIILVILAAPVVLIGLIVLAVGRRGRSSGPR